MKNNLFHIKNLSYSIGENLILDNISFSLEKGEALAIIGESGSGKSMLSKLMMGLIYPNSRLSGEILYYDENILSFSQERLRKYRGEKVGYITQNPSDVFPSFLKIKEVFLETLKSHSSYSKAQILEIASSKLEEVNLKDPKRILEQYPFELSGGMLQRIMIALVLSLGANVIIADEPTSALDSYNRHELIHIFKNLKEKGITLLIITHDYFLSENLSERILVIKKGKLIEEILNTQRVETEYAKELLHRKRYLRRDEK